MDLASSDSIHQILKECRTIAVVGLSSNPARPSYSVAGYMKRQSYRVIPVNPHEVTVLGEQAYPSLAAVPDKIISSIFSGALKKPVPWLMKQSGSAPKPCGYKRGL